ncbi:MAG TPA: YtxH domain-containing protein [Candidatus Eisenbacteria bacterium]|nr:YtxH domain-containing protein [Candidatus Eisenbacteria bacterium]
MYENIDSRESGNGMMAFALGMLVGAVTALLLAPASGTETRRKLGQVASNVGDKAKQGLDATKQFVNDQKDRFSGAVEEGRQTYRKETTQPSSTM